MGFLARHGGWAVMVTCSLVTAEARAADADEKTQCIAASDQGQQLRDDGKFKDAREAFARCARTSCPAIVARDCAAWLVDVDQRSPTVLFDARDDKGNDLSAVQVTVDGAPLAAELNGLPTAVDPGDHVFRYEAAGYPPVEDHVTIAAGDKNRVLHVRFASAPAVAPPALPSKPDKPGPTVPAGTWVFGAVAVAAFASEAYFGVAGLDQRSKDLSGPTQCAPQCSSDEKSSIQTKFIVADVSLGVGVVATGLATYFFFHGRRGAPAPAVGVDFAPRPGGAVASVGGRF
ncbi:MAG TPA: hypothetical protein VGM06_01645 [Polyangiaceae bacterium]|jgi:hypothetical protein